MPFRLLATFGDRLLASDPGFTRFLLASRVTLAVALTVLALSIGAALFDIGITVAILGAIVAMQASLAINDDDARTTTLLAPLPGTVGIVLGALFASSGVLADVVFLAVLFAAVAVRARGPRWTAFGTIAMMTYFFALFLGATVAQLPALIAAVFIAIGFTFAVRFVLLPDRPAWIAKRTVEAFEARIRFVTLAAVELLETRDASAGRRRLRSAVARLKETAISIESRLGEDTPAELRIIFDAQLAAEELATAAQAVRDAGVDVPRAVRLALVALALGRPERAARVARHTVGDSRPIHATARALAASIVDMSGTIVRVNAATPTLALTDKPWGGGAGIQAPVLRQAIQVTAASAVAIAVGEALSPQRWYWAVLATYFSFIGAASSGETFSRAWSRIIGTALGVAAGIVVGHLAVGHPWLDLGAIFACLFAGVYLLRISLMMMIFFVTAMLALLYTVLGRFTDGLLGIRLLETAIGALCGGAAATLILPTRTRDVVRASAHAALDAVASVVHASITRLLDTGAQDEPLEASRILEESVAHFTARTKPAIAVPALIGRGHELRRWTVSLNACSYYARLLARAADRTPKPPDSSAAEQLRRLDEIIAANIHAASERVDGRHDGVTVNTLPLLKALREHANGHAEVEPSLLAAARLLERIDRTISGLARDEDTITDIA
jgi:uncharacterized membrane protein YccC